jgi:hypothetical protein
MGQKNKPSKKPAQCKHSKPCVDRTSHLLPERINEVSLVGPPLDQVEPDTLPASGLRLCPFQAPINPQPFFPFLVSCLPYLASLILCCTPTTYNSSFVFPCLQVAKLAHFRAQSSYSSLASYWFTVFLRESIGAHLLACKFPPNLYKSCPSQAWFVLVACFMLVSCLAYSSALKTEAITFLQNVG